MNRKTIIVLACLAAVLVLVIMSACATKATTTPTSAAPPKPTTATAAPPPTASPKPSPTPVQVMKIKSAHGYAENSARGVLINMVKDAWFKATNGQVDMQVFPNASLYKQADAELAAERGDIQVVPGQSQTLGQLDQRFTTVNVPGLYENFSHIDRFLVSDKGAKVLDQVLEQDRGMKSIAWYPASRPFETSGTLWFTKKQVKTMDDLNGLKLRMAPSGYAQPLAKRMGFNAVSLAVTELPSAMEQGIIQGYHGTVDMIVTYELYKAAPFGVTIRHWTMDPIEANLKWWNNLPADLRNKLEQATHEASAQFKAWWLKEDLVFRDKIKANGVQIQELFPAADEARMSKFALEIIGEIKVPATSKVTTPVSEMAAEIERLRK